MDKWSCPSPFDVVSFFGLLVVMFLEVPAAQAIIVALVCGRLLPGIRWQSGLWIVDVQGD